MSPKPMENMGACGYCSNEEPANFLKTTGHKLIWSIIARNSYGLEFEDAYQEALIATARAARPPF